MQMRVAGVLGLAVALGAVGCTGSSSGGGNGGGASAPLQHPTSLKGASGVNDAFVISLTDQAGKPIQHLAAGTYKVEVVDGSTIHNFHLSGPGVDDSTPIGSKVTKAFTVTFKPGTYNFLCDPHSSQMHGSFTVS